MQHVLVFPKHPLCVKPQVLKDAYKLLGEDRQFQHSFLGVSTGGVGVGGEKR